MRITFLIGTLAWLVFSFLSFSYGEEGLDMRNYADTGALVNYAIITWLVCLFSIIMAIVGMVKVKKKGGKFLGIFSLIISLFLSFWITVMIVDSGVDLDEIYYGLIGFGVTQALLFFIYSQLSNNKKPTVVSE